MTPQPSFEHSININNGTRMLKVPDDALLLAALAKEKIFLPSACGGRGACGYCRIKIVEPPSTTAAEDRVLSDDDRARGVRLACQTRIRSDLRVFIPPEILTTRGMACICGKITRLTNDIRSFRLKLPARGALKFTPGQYIQLLVPSGTGRPDGIQRAYSIASDPADSGSIELIIRLAPSGISTNYCFNELKPGNVMHITGPYGDFQLRNSEKPILFIAGGSGFAPIKCMLHHLRNNQSHRPIRFFFGARHPDDLFYLDLMREFERDLPDFHFIPAVARSQPTKNDLGGFTPIIGLVTDAIRANLTDAANYEAYMCGGSGMIDAGIKLLKELDLSEESIYYDKFV